MMKMVNDNNSEILAPVGGQEQLIAAVRSGANAVYLGTNLFNARRNAENFSALSLSEAVSYCKARGVKTYITLNTLIMDSEIDELLAEISVIAKSGADAVIVQDLAVARLIKSTCPSLPIHASTQMTVHNLSGVKVLEELGFKRVVLARELSLKEIECISKNTKLEIEVFVHGSLCMSVSGTCYMSSLLGERSGNRGLCAQPCRLDFSINNRNYALSLKDMSHIENINALSKAGVNCFKIEGRMKRPEYVAAAVTACKKALLKESYDINSLRAVFSRSGFTDGYLTGKRDLSMFGYRRKEDVVAASGSLKGLKELYKLEYPSVPVNMRLTVKENQPSSLLVEDGENKINTVGELPQKANNEPISESSAKRSLEKTGGTPFYLNSLVTEIEEGLFLSSSALNNLRRQSLEALLEKRARVKQHPFKPFNYRITPYDKAQKPLLRIRAQKYEQLSLLGTKSECFILPLAEIEENIECISLYKDSLICEIPALFFPGDEDRLKTRLFNLKAKGLKNVITDNIGGIHLAKQTGLKVFAGAGLNILNSIALKEFENLGVEDITVSFELSIKKIKELGGSIKRGIIAYGRLPLMRFRTCPSQSDKGCLSCSGESIITDRRSIEFPLICSEKRYSTMLNSVALYIADKKPDGLDFLTLYFTTESAQECKKTVYSYINNSYPPLERTNGLYFRELK